MSYKITDATAREIAKEISQACDEDFTPVGFWRGRFLVQRSAEIKSTLYGYTEYVWRGLLFVPTLSSPNTINDLTGWLTDNHFKYSLVRDHGGFLVNMGSPRYQMEIVHTSYEAGGVCLNNGYLFSTDTVAASVQAPEPISVEDQAAIDALWKPWDHLTTT